MLSYHRNRNCGLPTNIENILIYNICAFDIQAKTKSNFFEIYKFIYKSLVSLQHIYNLIRRWFEGTKVLWSVAVKLSFQNSYFIDFNISLLYIPITPIRDLYTISQYHSINSKPLRKTFPHIDLHIQASLGKFRCFDN